MNSNLIDKILLGLLIMLLPIGLVISSKFLVEDQLENQTAAAALDAEKLQAAINDAVRQQQPVVVTPKPFAIAEVSYASESGIFQMKGTAPAAASNIVMSVTVLPPAGSLTIEEQIGSVKGVEVQTLSVIPEDDGAFVFAQEIKEDLQTGVIEIRLEQNDSVKTVRFDLAKRKQLL